MDLAWRSGMRSYTVHVCISGQSPNPLTLLNLTHSMKKYWQKWWKQNGLAGTRRGIALHAKAWPTMTTMFHSPFTPKLRSLNQRNAYLFMSPVSYYTCLGRVVFVYHTRLNTSHCSCAKSKRSCGMYCRYQEWKDSLHNLNDHILLDLPLYITLGDLLQVINVWWYHWTPFQRLASFTTAASHPHDSDI